jgi:hypothetical protein
MNATFWTLKNHLDAFACFEDSVSAALWLESASSICAAEQNGTDIEECKLVARLDHLVALTKDHVLPYLRLQEERHDLYERNLKDDTTAIAKYIALRHETPDPDTASDVLTQIDNALFLFYLNEGPAPGERGVIDMTPREGRADSVRMTLVKCFARHGARLGYKALEEVEIRTLVSASLSAMTGTTESSSGSGSGTSDDEIYQSDQSSSTDDGGGGVSLDVVGFSVKS